MAYEWLLAADSPDTSPGLSEAPQLVLDTIRELAEGFVANLPLLGLALVVFVVGTILSNRFSHLMTRGLDRTRVEGVVVGLIGRVTRLVLVMVAALVALSVAGVDVGAAIAGLGIAGLALAFALQNILENLVAGVLLMFRKPFVAGDEIRSGDHGGMVQEIDLRVTRLLDYDGEEVRIPNADIYRNPLVNVTRPGRRRSHATFGIEYRDDHTRVADLIGPVVAGIDGVMDQPAPLVLMTGLGDSSVDFEVLYWTRPQTALTLTIHSNVMVAIKSALQDAGYTIPWPIRTLAVDNPADFGVTART